MDSFVSLLISTGLETPSKRMLAGAIAGAAFEYGARDKVLQSIDPSGIMNSSIPRGSFIVAGAVLMSVFI